MFKAWILILHFSSAYEGSVYIERFSDEASCKSFGSFYELQLDGFIDGVDWKCVEALDPIKRDWE